MRKKIYASICLLAFVVTTNFSFIHVVAAAKNPWTYENARHLAQRALFGPTEAQVQQLFTAGSAEAAIDVLFPSIAGPDRTAFDAKLLAITSDPWFNGASTSQIYKYYGEKKLADPYQAKAKLFSIIEDTFSVNRRSGDDLSFFDIENTHNMLYSHTLGNYKEMVKRNLYNNGSVGDYSLGKFLDLFNQRYPNNPNENYARELLQLLLMEEYIPTKGADVGGVRNYSETDVNLFAKILVGFEADENTHAVTFSGAVNTNMSAEFLDGPLKSGDSFPFYDGSTGNVDIQALKTPIGGNNGLPDNIVDYVFSKREDAIALFIADKIFRFYIHETPTFAELEEVANILKTNNFELYPSIKQILALEVMYSTASLNSIYYKNPLELILWTHAILGVDSTDIYSHSLSDLSWTPYIPGSIFGRDGFDNNASFFSAYTSVKWQAAASRILREMDVASFIDPTITDRASLVTYLEDKIYLGQRLPADVRAKLITFLGTDENSQAVVFDLTNTTYLDTYVKSAILLMLVQPEYVLKSGLSVAPKAISSWDRFYGDSNSKLIILKNYGGADWLHYIIPKAEYAEYVAKRGTIAVPEAELLSLNDEYYIHPKLAEIKALFDSGDVKIINRVGTTNHSRSHSAASYKMASLNNTFALNDKGILGGLIENELASKTIVMGSSSPDVLRGWKYVNLASEPFFTKRDSVSNDFFDYRVTTLKDIGNNRTYPSDSNQVFVTSYQVDDIWNQIKAATGRSSIGWNMQTVFSAAEPVLDSSLANVVIMRADGWYDTHRNQVNTLNTNLERVSQRTAEYYNRVKGKQDITLVFYSEFGRTLKANASDGTDHGKGGWMIIFTNNAKLKQALPEKVYGNNSFKDAVANRLWVGIDYRSVYSTVYKALYDKDVSAQLGKNYDISTYIDSTAPDLNETRIEFVDNNRNNQSRALLSFNIDDDNFINSQGSYISVAFGTDPNNLNAVSRYYIDRYMDIYDDRAQIILWNVNSATRYYYKVVVHDNQYNKTTLEGTFRSPREVVWNNGAVGTGESTRFDAHKNSNITGQKLLTDNAWQGLSLSGTLMWEEGVSLISGTGWFITHVTSSSGTTLWNGDFIAPRKINKKHFLRKNAQFNGLEFSKMNIDSLVKVGAWNIGVGMKLNKKVTLDIPTTLVWKTFTVLSSEDGLVWTAIPASDLTQEAGKIKVKTDHFSYFIVVESDSSGAPKDTTYVAPTPETPSSSTRSGGGWRWWGGWYSTKVWDVCPEGDFTLSRYDGKCWVDPDKAIATAGLNMDANGEYTIWEKFSEKELTNNTKHSNDETERNYPKVVTKQTTDSFSGQTLSKKQIVSALYAKLETKKIGVYTVYNLKDSDMNNTYNAQASAIIHSGAMKSKKNALLQQLRNVVILEGLLSIEWLPSNLQTKISNVTSIYKTAFETSYKKVMDQKYGSQTNDTPKNPNETIREKIIRLNKQKKLKQSQGDAGTDNSF